MFLSRIEGRALSDFEGWRPDFLLAFGNAPGIDAPAHVLDDVRERFRELLAVMPDPGFRAPLQRAFSISGAMYIAVYLALHPRGFDAARAWDVCDEATRAHFGRLRGFARWASSAGMFSSLTRWLTQSLAKRSRAEPVGGWVAHYVAPEPGVHDFGVTYSRCAIRDLAIAQGAADFAPYICLADIIGSEEFGWGLRRTETLAQGGTRCDFRFRRNQPTDVVRRLPIV
jgi:hypothetical protein